MPFPPATRPFDLQVTVGGVTVVRRAAEGEFILGREAPAGHVRVDHPAVSRLHVRLLPGARWQLVDFESRNGVYVDGHRILNDIVIDDGMTIHLGAPHGVPVTFHYRPANPEARATDEATERITPVARRHLLVKVTSRALCDVAQQFTTLPAHAPHTGVQAPQLERTLADIRTRLAAAKDVLPDPEGVLGILDDLAKLHQQRLRPPERTAAASL
ncbi:hypothetical protein A7U43_28525 (plasmid) [Mycobacterium adipatum]|uniref:FHA domain-containing protein n=1 Tax=Mycobacterium adipatum TaxID=1682113 RepID=A0A172UWG5_9MYCO|nr:hypothetical protein A7U43_28525 [Mycobacterium adipatum]